MNNRGGTALDDFEFGKIWLQDARGTPGFRGIPVEKHWVTSLFDLQTFAETFAESKLRSFLMLHNKNLIFDLFIRKIRKKYNGAYG